MKRMILSCTAATPTLVAAVQRPARAPAATRLAGKVRRSLWPAPSVCWPAAGTWADFASLQTLKRGRAAARYRAQGGGAQGGGARQWEWGTGERTVRAASSSSAAAPPVSLLSALRRAKGLPRGGRGPATPPMGNRYMHEEWSRRFCVAESGNSRRGASPRS